MLELSLIMPTYRYSARTKSGERTEGTLEAASQSLAMAQLESRGLLPVSLREGRAKTTAKSGKARKRRFEFQLKRGPRAARMKRREMLIFSRELSDLLASGMTLGNALHSLAQRDSSEDQDVVIAELRDEIVQGGSLSEALRRRPETFPSLYVSMVRAGEVSGRLSDSLEQLCNHYERTQSAREKVITALVYPLFVLIAGLATMVFTLIFIVPRFQGIFRTLGSDLPLPTQILIAVSQFVINYGWLILVLVIGALGLFRKYIATPGGRKAWDRIKLRIPVVRSIITTNAYAHFARTLGALLENGVPVLQALSIVETTLGNVVLAEEIRNARGRVTDGSSLSGPLAAGRVFPRLLIDMLAVGEQTGDVPGALRHITRRYDNELERNITMLTTILEPLLIVFMAVFVGYVVLSMMLAVFDMTSGLNI